MSAMWVSLLAYKLVPWVEGSCEVLSRPVVSRFPDTPRLRRSPQAGVEGLGSNRMYSGNRVCFTCGKGNCPGHARVLTAGPVVVRKKASTDRPRKIDKREDHEAYMQEIEQQEALCNRLLVEKKIGPLEHWTARNQLEELRRRKDVSRRIAIAERVNTPQSKKLTIADLKRREGRQ